MKSRVVGSTLILFASLGLIAKAESPIPPIPTPPKTDHVGDATAAAVGETPAPYGAADYATRRQLDAAVRVIESQSDDIRKLRADLQRTTDLLNEQIGEQKQILDRISEKDSAGNPIVNLRANMQSPEFQKDMKTAVNTAIEQFGTLRVENQMLTTQTIAVNYVTYVLPPLTVKDVAVPVGTVTTELVGYEPAKHLALAAPSYFQRLIIAPPQPIMPVMLGSY